MAMHAASRNNIKDLPNEFYHDSTFTDNYGKTVAMHAALSGRI